MNTTHGTPAGDYPADPSFARARKKRLFRWGAGITLAGFLAGGGIALAAVAGGPAAGSSAAGSSSAGSSSAGSSAAGPISNGQGAVLNSALNAAAAPGSSTTPARVRRALGRLRLFGGIHGEVTFHNKTGFHTLAFERGTIQSVTGGNVVVKAPDGTTWTWLIVSDTVVRKNGAKTTASALSAGETVFAGGPVAGADKDARLIVIRPAGSPGSSPSAGPSASSSGSGSTQSSLPSYQQTQRALCKMTRECSGSSPACTSDPGALPRTGPASTGLLSPCERPVPREGERGGGQGGPQRDLGNASMKASTVQVTGHQGRGRGGGWGFFA